MKPWTSWILLLVSAAPIAFFSVERWSTRIILFAIMAVPVTLWARHQMNKAATRPNS